MILFEKMSFYTNLRYIKIWSSWQWNLHYSWYLVIRAYCRASRSCRVHCRKLKTVPVVHRHVLVYYISVPSIMVRLERYLKAPQSIISLSCTFLGHPVERWKEKKDGDSLKSSKGSVLGRCMISSYALFYHIAKDRTGRGEAVVEGHPYIPKCARSTGNRVFSIYRLSK